MKRRCMSVLAMVLLFVLAMPCFAYGNDSNDNYFYYYYEYQKSWYTILEELNPEDYAGLYCKGEQLHIIPTKPEKIQAYLDSLNLSELEKKTIIIDDETVLYSLADLRQAREKLVREKETYKIRGIPTDIHNNRLIVALEEFPTKPGMAEIWLDDFYRITGMDNIKLMTVQEYVDAGYGYSEGGYYALRYVIEIDSQKPENGKITCLMKHQADFDAYIRGEDIMIPLRALIVTLNITNDEDYTIEWIEGKNQINLNLNNRKVMLDLDKNTLQIGGITIPCYQPPERKNGKVYVSSKDMGQILKLSRERFYWDSSTNTLSFDYDPLPPDSCPWEI